MCFLGFQVIGVLVLEDLQITKKKQKNKKQNKKKTTKKKHVKTNYNLEWE